MTAEQQYEPEVAVETASTAIELYSPQHQQRMRRGIGRTSLDGFTILEEAESSWNDAREQLGNRIIAQPAAIDAIIEVLEASSVRLLSDKRPIANLAFLGPTGVGKSETAKSLPEYIGGDKKFIKIDCSDYSHGHEVANLTGSPLGYVGHDQTPTLTQEAVGGYGTVVLFDEIEKGSEPLYNLMLQIMEDGVLQLKGGGATSFRDAIIIMTSNLGAKEMAAQLSSTPLGFASRNQQASNEQLDEVATKSFKEFFRPEFINRLSKMVVFHPLDQDSLGQVLESKVAQASSEYEDDFGIRISLSDGARDYLVDIASQELHMGARPLVRALDNHVYTAFGRYWCSGAVSEGTHVKVFHSSEVGDRAGTEETALVFAAKRDRSIRKKPPVVQQLEVAFTDKTNSANTEAVEPEEKEPDPEPEE